MSTISTMSMYSQFNIPSEIFINILTYFVNVLLYMRIAK
jgi:hypothetical protein